MILSEWMAVTVVAGIAIISPGPGFAIVVKNSLNQGRQAGMATALGNAVGDLTHIAFNMLGIGLLLANSPTLFEVIKTAGASYLVWLGIKGLLSKPSSSSQEKFNRLPPKGNSFRAFLDGLVTTILNPKAFIFVFALFSVVVSTETPFHQRALYGGWIGLISLVWFAIVAVFFTDKKLRLKLEKNRHWLNRITGVILIFFAIEILVTSPLDIDQTELTKVEAGSRRLFA